MDPIDVAPADGEWVQSDADECDARLHRLGDALRALGRGDVSVRIPPPVDGQLGDVEHAFNTLAEQYERALAAAPAVHPMASNLTNHVRGIARVLANMSHEIRTPLNSMMILAQMLAANDAKNLTPRQQEWAVTIHAAGRDLLALINQILDLSRVEAGRIDTHAEPYAVADAARSVERTFRPVALDKQLDFAIEIRPTAPASVTTDHQLVEQILKNLLANAFKFTDHGGVKLIIERAAEPVSVPSQSLQRAAAVVALSVIDTGIGIASDQLDRIFEAFQQADASITRKYGGTGLGLAISREYARVLGGEIAVASSPGLGSTFTLYLPVVANENENENAPAALSPTAPAPAQPAAIGDPEAPSDEAPALAGKKILIIEDDVRNLYAETAVLERYAANVITAQTAQDAYAKLREHPDIDLVLMDIMMPDIDGYQATREIRQMPDHHDLPIIAVTANAAEADRALCLAAGCSDFLVKPADARQLVAAIRRNLSRRHLRARLTRPAFP